MLRRSFALLVPSLLVLPIASLLCQILHAASPEDVQRFEAEVRPILADRCYGCHGEEKQKGGLRLDSLATILDGGDSGPALVPGEPEESLLVEAIQYESFEMPPSKPLSSEEVAVLTSWVRQGAPWPDAEEEGAAVREKPEKLSDEDRAYWAFQPVSEVEPPPIDDGGWARNAIDLFVLQRLQEQGLAPAPEADRRVLIRRLYFDLIGLPPTPDEIEAFVADSSPTAYEDLVDRLLKSPRYGERWARHWLDLVRYAESDGYKQDGYRPHAWRYRDYVIRAFNDDKPYDRFVMEQLAGDEIAPHDLDALAATSLLRHWVYEYNQRDVRTQWDNILNDVTDVTGELFLGLSVGCARCHDHKFDPILQEDYYRLRAFFAPLTPRDDIPYLAGDDWAQYQQELQQWEEETADIREEIAEIEQPHRQKAADAAINKFPPDIRPMMRMSPEHRTPLEHQLAELANRQVLEQYKSLDVASKLKGEEKERYEALQEKLADFEEQKPAEPPPAFTVTDVGPEAPVTTIPGDSSGRDIAPGFLSVLDPREAEILEPPAVSRSTGRRYTLAKWLTHPDNPLTTRVIVNRVWQYHFGQGIVGTASNLGHLGQRPSHPELLDWLANWFVENGWRFKPLHRMIVTSAAYRQGSDHPADDAARQEDLENRLLWHIPMRRLAAEQIRDASLAVTGELELKIGGPSAERDGPRRTIYTKVIRNSRNPLLEVFDAPDGFSPVSQRSVTTTPIQSLLMINGDWMLERARNLAERLQREHPGDDEKLVEAAFERVCGHRPTAEQKKGALAFLERQRTEVIPAEAESSAAEDRTAASLVDLCHVLLNSNEFLYVE